MKWLSVAATARYLKVSIFLTDVLSIFVVTGKNAEMNRIKEKIKERKRTRDGNKERKTIKENKIQIMWKE
jgi:hypothetical protein